MSTGVLYCLALFYSDFFTSQILQPQPPITEAANLFCLLLFSPRAPKNTPQRHLHMPPDIIKRLFLLFFFLLVSRQLLFESETNDRRSSPLANHHCGQESKVRQPDKCPAKASWRGVKETLLKRARRLSKNQPLASAHQERAGACPFPWRGRASGRPQCLRGDEGGWVGVARETSPRTQWCFRADSSGPSQAYSIPSPTVTPGTRLSPFKHIICARMAAKRHTHTHTHSGPSLIPCHRIVVAAAFLSIIEPLKDLDGVPFPGICRLDQPRANLRTIESLHISKNNFTVSSLDQRKQHLVWRCFCFWKPPDLWK